MTVTPTPEKVGKVLAAVRGLKKKPFTTIRHVAQVTGTLMATNPGNPWASLFTRQLEIEKIAALQEQKFDFDAPMTISNLILRDLLWWEHNARTMQAKIMVPHPHLTIFTDASTLGYGLYVPFSNTRAGS